VSSGRLESLDQNPRRGKKLQAQIRVRRNPFASGYCVGAKPFSTTEFVSGVGNWDEGGSARVAMHTAGGALVAALGGGNALGGAAGAATSAVLAGNLNDISNAVTRANPTGDDDANRTLGNILANALAGSAGGLVGGNSGSFSGANVDLYNARAHCDNGSCEGGTGSVLSGIGSWLADQFASAGRGAVVTPPVVACGPAGCVVSPPVAVPGPAGYVPDTATLANDGQSPNANEGNNTMLGADGAQFASKTIWKGDGKERIDVENPNPGQRPGQIHYQDSLGNKYLYDPSTNSFPDAPNSVNKLLNDPGFNAEIQKGLNKYLGGT
jgi:filamentous hemagglutinin